MGEPSEYELEVWRNIQAFKGRPVSRQVRNAADRAASGVSALGDKAGQFLEDRPRAQSAISRSQEVAAKGAKSVGSGARKAADAMPDWSTSALGSVRTTIGKASRAGLSPKKVVKEHKKRGHDVVTLTDVRRLDLEQVDSARGRLASWGYPALAAASGAASGLAITGGQMVTVVSAGAGAAPSSTAILGTLAADTATMLGLASRAVGRVALFHGYDPEAPAEKLFVMSVVNAGTAASSGAKTAAMRDISRLTQALVRGKSWELLNKSVVARVSTQFAKAMGVRLTKQGLGRVLPAVGIVIGGTMNWATLEGINDAAEIAYRRRFLLEKYPQLADDEVSVPMEAEVADEDDETISVLAELTQAGGPDLTSESDQPALPVDDSAATTDVEPRSEGD